MAAHISELQPSPSLSALLELHKLEQAVQEVIKIKGVYGQSERVQYFRLKDAGQLPLSVPSYLIKLS